MDYLNLTIAAGFDFSTLPQQLVNGILIGSIYALIALGYTMVYGVLRLINFAHGEVFMLGAYTALFTSWALGFSPAQISAGQSPQGSVVTLLIMILASMVICAAVGAAIEFFAYRPMRNQSRIAALITAIGVSLLLQFGGQLFLPSVPQNVAQSVNPFQGSLVLPLRQAPLELRNELSAAQKTAADLKAQMDARVAAGEDRFNPSAEGRVLRDAQQTAERKASEVNGRVLEQTLEIKIPYGKLTMFLTAIALMLLLRYIVMGTPAGRAMRAVSHDFDSASLMGVNVNRVITFTFVLGSALAGAGAMMNSTFEGTSITTFSGVQLGVKAFVAAVLGGIGNIPGAVLGGLLMGVAETLVVWSGNAGYRDAIAFVVLIAVLLLRPGGLLGSSKVEKV